jgi:peptidoglycan-associated lipoprotein
MKRINTLATLAAILITAMIAFGCRTRVQDRPVTQPEVTDTAPDISPTPVPTPETSVQPDDFVQEQVTTDEIPADIAEANRLAHERGWLRDAFFNYDEASLSADAQEALTVSAQWLKNNPNYRLTVEGHCDERGTEQYNLALGDRRANVAKDYLVTLGVDASRIQTVSYGEERPFETGSSDAAWAQNRRAHLVLTR